MFNAPSTPKAKSRSARLFSRLLSRSSNENEIPALAGGVSVPDADAELCDLYLAAGIRPPTPLLKSCARFDGPTPQLPAPAPGYGRVNKSTYVAPRGAGLGLKNVKVCPVKPIGWKTWPAESDSLPRSDSTDSEDRLLPDSVFAARDEDSGYESEEDAWSLDDISPENLRMAIRSTKMVQRKRVIAGMRARATGWN